MRSVATAALRLAHASHLTVTSPLDMASLAVDVATNSTRLVATKKHVARHMRAAPIYWPEIPSNDVDVDGDGDAGTDGAGSGEAGDGDGVGDGDGDGEDASSGVSDAVNTLVEWRVFLRRVGLPWAARRQEVRMAREAAQYAKVRSRMLNIVQDALGSAKSAKRRRTRSRS